MEQHLYDPVHEEFRDLCREFLAREAVPHHARWEADGIVDRRVWRSAGAAGLLGMDVDPEYGGGGQRDFRFNAVLVEEIVAVTIARTFVNHCVAEFNAGRLSVTDAAKVKWWTTELQNRVADRCVQLHGGYGFMLEHPVAKAWLDSRVQTIYGGTTEIMKEIIGRGLGL